MLKAQKKAVEAPVAEAKQAVQKAVAKPAAAVREEAKKTVSRFERKKAEVQKAAQKPIAEARTLCEAICTVSLASLSHKLGQLALQNSQITHSSCTHLQIRCYMYVGSQKLQELCRVGACAPSAAHKICKQCVQSSTQQVPLARGLADRS